jgi:hypothetical protein
MGPCQCENCFTDGEECQKEFCLWLGTWQCEDNLDLMFLHKDSEDFKCFQEDFKNTKNMFYAKIDQILTQIRGHCEKQKELNLYDHNRVENKTVFDYMESSEDQNNCKVDQSKICCGWHKICCWCETRQLETG